MPRLMVTDCYRDRLITYKDFENHISTADVERFAREVLHHHGEIREKGHEWWVCGSDRKPVYIVFEARPAVAVDRK